MNKPNWKYTKVSKQDVGRELANPSYVEYLEEELRNVNKRLAELIEAIKPALPY